MDNASIQKLTMPKWGLSMSHGTVVEWLLPEGAAVSPGTEVLEVETEKITGTVESTVNGTLRRYVATPGQEVAVGGLLGVIADPTVSEQAIANFVDAFEPEEVPETATADAPEPHYLEVAGFKLRYLKLGEGGHPLVLVHGFSGDLNNWLFNHTVLAEQRTVYAIDLPGHGHSSKDVGDGRLGFLAEALRSWLDAMELSTADFVGHSLGGGTVLEFALQHPDRARSLCLIASTGLGPEISANFIRGIVVGARRKALKPHLETLFAEPQRVTRQLVDDVLKYKRLDGVGEALGRIADAFVQDETQAYDFRQRLKELEMPLQVIWGARDQIIPAHHAAGLPARVEVRIFEHAGHMVQMEAAHEVNALIGEFLSRLDA